MVKKVFQVLKEALQNAKNDKVTKLSGSLAYATVFSMAPLLLIVIAVAGFLLGRAAVEGKVYETLSSFLGKDTSGYLQQIIQHTALFGKTTLAEIIGIATLLVGATSVFGEIQDSINIIWGIKPKPRKGWMIMIKNRFLSFSIIISLGFLLLVSLGVNYLIDGFSHYLVSSFPR